MSTTLETDHLRTSPRLLHLLQGDLPDARGSALSGSGCLDPVAQRWLDEEAHLLGYSAHGFALLDPLDRRFLERGGGLLLRNFLHQRLYCERQLTSPLENEFSREPHLFTK